jgi:LmbE family N-acetylglucosaminyl deacetylase
LQHGAQLVWSRKKENVRQNLLIPSTHQKTGLVVIAHADDLVLFAGTAVLALVDAGWDIHVVRVTDDRWDSWGLDAEKTIAANHVEFHSALRSLGITKSYELGLATDQLGDHSEVNLRNNIVELIRQIRPYLIMTFDPDSIMYEDNEDHRLVGRATNEASWTSGFDKHPDGKVDQFRTHLPIERWYFGRNVIEVTHQQPIEPYRQRLIDVIAQHKTMLQNMVAQLDVQARFLGYSLSRLQSEVEKDPRFFAQLLIGNKEFQDFRVIDAKNIQSIIGRFGEEL